MENSSISGAAFIRTSRKWDSCTTQSNVSAIVGKCDARTKAFEGPLCQGREADVRCAATIPVMLESALLQREAEPEMKRPYPSITTCWAANNYYKRRSEQALLWEGVTLLNVSIAGGRVHSTGDDPHKKLSCRRGAHNRRSASHCPELETRKCSVVTLSHCHNLASAPILHLALAIPAFFCLGTTGKNG